MIKPIIFHMPVFQEGVADLISTIQEYPKSEHKVKIENTQTGRSVVISDSNDIVECLQYIKSKLPHWNGIVDHNFKDKIYRATVVTVLY